MSSLKESLKSEYLKLERRAKSAEKKFQEEAKAFYQRIIDAHKEREQFLQDLRDEHSERYAVSKIQTNIDKIENLIFNSDYQLTEIQEAHFIRLVDKTRQSYEQLSDAFVNARVELSDQELDAYYRVGINIAELSDELIDLLLNDDIEAQVVVLETCAELEESCDVLLSCIEANYYQAA